MWCFYSRPTIANITPILAAMDHVSNDCLEKPLDFAIVLISILIGILSTY